MRFCDNYLSYIIGHTFILSLFRFHLFLWKREHTTYGYLKAVEKEKEEEYLREELEAAAAELSDFGSSGSESETESESEAHGSVEPAVGCHASVTKF